MNGCNALALAHCSADWAEVALASLAFSAATSKRPAIISPKASSSPIIGWPIHAIFESLMMESGWNAVLAGSLHPRGAHVPGGTVAAHAL